MVYAPKTGIKLPGTSGNYVSTPDTALLDITGDQCVIAQFKMPDWSPASPIALVSKWLSAGNQRSWLFLLDPSGLQWLSTTTGVTPVGAASSISIPFSNNSVGYVAFTYDQSESTAYYWYSYNNLDWFLLGDPVTAAASVFSGTANLEIGSYSNGTSYLNSGIALYAALYNGIGDNSQPGLGTLVAEFDAAKCKPRYRDSTGKIWTLNGSDSTMEKA